MATTSPHPSSRPASNSLEGSGPRHAQQSSQHHLQQPPPGAAASVAVVVPPEDRRFVEKMRRRTTVRLDNPDAIDEARRAGTYVADRILQRTVSSSAVLAASSTRGSGVARSASMAGTTQHPLPPARSSSGLISPTSSTSSSLLFRASGGGGESQQLFHSATLAPASTSLGRSQRGGSASSTLMSGPANNSSGRILDERRGSYLLDSFARGDNWILPTIPSFDMSVESSHDPRARASPNHEEDDFAVDEEADEVMMMDPPASEHEVMASSSSGLRHRRPNFSRQDSERAVRRGSRRGVREANERASAVEASEAALRASGARVPATLDDDWSSYSDIDLTTITDAFTDFTTKESERRRRREQRQQVESERSKAKRKKGSRKKFMAKPKWLALGSSDKRGRKRSTSYSRSDTGGGDHPSFHAHDSDEDDLDDEDAWMCGVCGQVFPSLEIAERHEDRHLRKVIQKLGWNTTSNDCMPNSPPTSPDAAMQAVAEHANEALQHLGYFQDGHDPNAMVPKRRAAAADSKAVGGRRPRFDSSDSIPNFRSAYGGGGADGFNRLSAGDRFYSVRHSHPDEEKVEEAAVVINTTQTQRNAGPGAIEQPSGPRKPAAVNNQNRLVSAGQYRSDLPEDTLIPTKRRPRSASGSEVRFEDIPARNQAEPPASSHAPVSTRLAADDGMPPLLMSDTMQNYVVLADEALLNVCWRATPLILAPNEVQAERHLAYLGKDKAYYDDIVARAQARRTNPSNRFRSDATDTLRGKVQNKLLDAYQLMKEGDANFARKDVYNRKQLEGGAAGENSMIHHSSSTMYVNVLVRNSVQVVKYELERLAREKWEHPDEGKEKYTRFELFRVYAHVNFVKLAGLALASDFTPRRIAIQLSNDIYRLLTPRLKRRGVTIGTEIEYRVGGYFVLAVNINTIDWARLIKTNNRDLKARKAKWRKDSSNKQHDDTIDEHAKRSQLSGLIAFFVAMYSRFGSLTKYDLIDYMLAWMFYLHWIVYLPICKLAYKTPGIGSTIRKFIIVSAIDEICYYVHERGMEMEIRVLKADHQASFMLSALREIRADGRELKKKRQETEAQEAGMILGPLLGPRIKEDEGPAIEPPGFELPANLDFVGLEVDLPVGFRRLRWAYLSRKSTFITEALWKAESKYENITISDWSKHSDVIGDPHPPPTVNVEDFIGAEFEASYLMPKSAFVSANMSYATSQLIAYNDYCFCVKTRSRNPDAPFGSTFVAWTQVLVINSGNNCCKLICSVEAEFPNGPPMVARQIQSGMRAGTGESFVLMGETISKYANAVP